MEDIIIVDELLEDPVGYRAMALTVPKTDVSVGPATFRGIGVCRDERVAEWIGEHFPNLVPTVTFFRQSPEGQPEPNFIHCDRSMGDWTGILYLSPEPPAEDGTTFWRRIDTGAIASTVVSLEDYAQEGATWLDPDAWEPWQTVPAAWNRLLLFPSALYHSRAMRDNHGVGDSARLIQVLFGRAKDHI